MIFAGVFMFYGKQVTPARVESIQPSSAAAAAGFKPGDLVLAIDGRKIETFADMQRIVRASPGQALEIVVDRGGVRQTLNAVPKLTESKDVFSNVERIGQLGIAGAMREPPQPVGPLAAIGLGVERTWFVIESTMSYIYRVVIGRESAEQLGGPVRIAQISGQVATLGFVPILDLAGVLSVSIGLLNLFPIPLLDGGHLLFYLIEAVRGRPLSERAQEIGFRIGLAMVLMLMIFATYNDLGFSRLWSKS